MTAPALTTLPPQPGPARRAWATGRAWLRGPAGRLLRAGTVRPGAAGAGVLTAWYLWCLLGDPYLPGSNSQYPLGWWGWFDQGKYLDSAQSLMRGALVPDRHWYPLGYSALAAPFTRWTQEHPFLPVNLGSLLLCYAGFLAFARRVGVERGWAVALFLLGTASSRLLFEGWIVPWNTIPAAALIWLLLATTAAHMQGDRRPLLIGLLATAIPLVRPTELLLAAPCVLAAIAASLWRPQTNGSPPDNGHAGRRPLRDIALLAAGALLAAAPYAALHWRIYGLGPSPYMAMSTGLGFTPYDLGWKAYTLLADPRDWFLDGHGLLWQAPWAGLALAGLAVAWAHGRAAGLLAVLILLHTMLYVSYVDLLPTGLWRFFNVHYWQWALPGLALLAFLAARDLLRWRRAPWFPLAPLAVAASLPLLLLRSVPVQVPAGVPAKMLAYAGPIPGFMEAYFTELSLRDSKGEMHGFGELRALPVPGGMRVYALRRPFGDDPAWLVPPPGWPGGTPVRYGIGWRLGVPCWTRLVRCRRLEQVLLPPEPKF